MHFYILILSKGFRLTAFYLTIVFGVLCSACSSYQVTRDAKWVLPRDAAIYIAYPRYVDEAEASSKPRMRFYLSQSLLRFYKNRFLHTVAGEESQSLKRAFHLAAVAQSDFLVYPQLNQFNDRHNTLVEHTKRQGLDDSHIGRDLIQISLALYDVRSRRLVDVIHLGARSGLALTGAGNAQAKMDKLLSASVNNLLFVPSTFN